MRTHTKQNFFIFLLLFCTILSSCKEQNKPAPEKIDQGFKEYVSAFTSGIISSHGNIQIQLVKPTSEVITPQEAIKNKLFTFTPDIKGECYWIDAKTIEFRPSQPLTSGQEYTGYFNLKATTKVESEFEKFPLKFQVIKQSFQVKDGELVQQTTDNTVYDYNGLLTTSDVMEHKSVEQLIEVIDDKQHNIIWTHEGLNHTFTIKDIERQETDSEITLACDGKPCNIDLKTTKTLEIPGLSNFKLINVQVIHQPSQYILLTFSDALQTDQNLRGIIGIKGIKSVQYIISGNSVKLYPKKRIIEEHELFVEKSVRNIFGLKLKSESRQKISFESLKPDVRLLGKGVIIPETQHVIFPFEAVNLSAVDVKVIKIYEDNIPQFLQANSLDGERDIRRVGRLVASERVDLVSDHLIDHGIWNAFSFDLAKLIEQEPGAVYRIEISFRKAYSLYPCENDTEEDIATIEEDWEDNLEVEQSYWDNGDYYYNNYGSYNWRDREDPCTSSYYRYKKYSRNVLSSNIGLIAKTSSKNELKVFVTDILTANPLANTRIKLVNFQQRPIGEGITNDKGMVTIAYDGVPYLAIAENKKQRGYLKLNKNAPLSLSKFDVSGAKHKKGIKGFIYGERGVWRPGDSIYIDFILEDKDKALPKAHPVLFELIDPMGKTIKREVKSTGVNHFYAFECATSDDAPTGNWTARVKVGGSVFTKQIKIETIKPNRLKIKLDFNKDIITKSDANLNASMEVKWLHGAIAPNLQAEIDMELSKAPTSFKTFTDYTFTDPSINFSAYEKRIFSGKTDAQGKATIKPTVDVPDNAPGMLKATFNTKVFEKGGNFSVNQTTIPYSPYNTYVGIKTPKGDKARGMLLTDVKHRIDVVTLNAKGEKVSTKNLVAKLYKIQWRWWWQAGQDNIGSYISRQNIQPILTKKLSTVNGIGSFDIEVNYPDWGRYIIKVETPEGHSAGKTVYIDWPGWAGRAQKEGSGATMLTFSADKEKYNVGEKANIVVPSSAGGRALVSIEKGSKVINAFWLETTKGNTTFELDITEEMTPNVYVHISMLQAHAQTVNDLPIRRFGVIPITVNDPKTKITPVITMQDELAPEKETAITISEKDGKEMTFTVAVVDEGLLDLTNYATPNPWYTFYAREALSVKTWDIYDLVFGAYGAQLEGCFAIGGDGDLAKNKDKKAKRFKPVVKHFGPFHIKAGASKEVKFTMPRYIGSVKTMVVASSKHAYGTTAKVTPVKSPLMLFATMPRVLSPGETVKLPVTVFALDESPKDVTVTMKSNGLVQAVGQASKILKFSQAGEQDFNFDVKASDQIGVATITIEASNGKHKATYDIEMDVRTPNPSRITNYSTILKPGDKWESIFEVFGIDNTNKAVLETSSIPPLNLKKRLRYLLTYPYGCVEQTTSSAFPQLYLDQLMELDKNTRATTKKNIEAALDRLRSFQQSNGGFSYWPNQNTVNTWGTSYVGHFMIEAEEQGYTLPLGMKQAWLNYQKTEANNWFANTDGNQDNAYNQAYRLYTLALANQANLAAMNRLREYEKLSQNAKYYLAMAYLYSGNKEAALSLISGAKQSSDSANYWGPYGSSMRNKAITLEALLTLEKYDDAMLLIKEISDALNNTNWMSTQTTAYCLRTMSKASTVFKKTQSNWEYSYQINDKKKNKVVSTSLVKQHELDVNEQLDSNQIIVKNLSDAPLYINLIVEGIPLVDNWPVESKNLELKVIYKSLDNTLLNPNSIEQGTDFMAEFTVSNPGQLGNYEDLALSAMFPSGWEIINTRLQGSGNQYIKDIADYTDIRDDRVNLFFDLAANKTKHFVVLLNASYLGEYTRPSINCVAMYNNNIRARIPGGTTKVVNPGN